MTRTDTSPNLTLKHMAKVARRSGPEGSHPATKATLRQPTARGNARPARYARVERGYAS